VQRAAAASKPSGAGKVENRRPTSDGKEVPRLGAKVRGLRRREGLSQAQLAERLGISPSYLNLIENNRRSLPAPVLIRLAQLFKVDLGTFATDEDSRTIADLLEVFADPLFEAHDITNVDVRELASSSPQAARAVVRLYRAYQSAREEGETLASRLHEGEQLAPLRHDVLPGADELDGEVAGGSASSPSWDLSRIPPEEVHDLLQRHMNYFPALEAGAEELWKSARLDSVDLFSGLVRHLEKGLGVRVRIAEWHDEPGTLRRFDPERRTLTLSELLPTRSRSFQVATQIGLLALEPQLFELAADPLLTTQQSRHLATVALASYFAGAVLMPYAPFLAAAQRERYDIDVIGRRFKVGFEQACHRLTTLQRPGAEGVPFHFVRTDIAGNFSKRFSGSGIRFARFAGACPRWNIFAAFSTPGMMRIQVSQMPDGTTYFCIAKTIQKDSGGYHAQHGFQAIGVGCQIAHARELVYADGIDLDNPDIVVPVGTTCRLCERTNCAQRVLPPIQQPLQVDPNLRRVTLFTVPPR
jgi:predicted transcriptional regulator/transcriptional regulator with XRE-family HTH domain